MVAGHVVPLDPVRVEIVEDGETGLKDKIELPYKDIFLLTSS